MVIGKKYNTGMLLLAFVVCTASVFTSFTLIDEDEEKRRIEEERVLAKVKYYKETFPEEKYYLDKIVKYVKKDAKDAVLFVDRLGIDPNIGLDAGELKVDNMFALALVRVLNTAASGLGQCDMKYIEELYLKGGNPNQKNWFNGTYSPKEIVEKVVPRVQYFAEAKHCANKIDRMFSMSRKELKQELLKKEEAKNAYKEWKKKQEEENNMNSDSQ